MPQLSGADEVRRQQKQLDAVFRLLDGSQESEEVRAHFARYLCVRLAGFAEEAIKILGSAYAQDKSSPAVHRFVAGRLQRLWGIDETKLRETLEAFDPEWWDNLQSSLPQEIASLNSVGKLRNNISHGKDAGIGMPQVLQYRDDVFRLVNYLCNLLDP